MKKEEEIPGANIAPPPKHDVSQYFSKARSLLAHNQGESTKFSRGLDFARLEVSSLLQSTLNSLKAWGIATLFAATPSPLGNWALNIALAKNQILYGRCTLMATTLQTLQCKAVSSSQAFYPSLYWIATSLPFFPLLECAFVVGGKWLGCADPLNKLGFHLQVKHLTWRCDTMRHPR